MYNYDYFYTNNAEITFSDEGAYYCFADFSVQPGETVDFKAMASIKGGDDLLMRFFKDEVQVGYTHQEGATSPTIDDHSAVIFYKGIVQNIAASFKLCIRGDGKLEANKMQWGYTRYTTQDNWAVHDNSEVPALDLTVSD